MRSVPFKYALVTIAILSLPGNLLRIHRFVQNNYYIKHTNAVDAGTFYHVKNAVFF